RRDIEGFGGGERSAPGTERNYRGESSPDSAYQPATARLLCARGRDGQAPPHPYSRNTSVLRRASEEPLSSPPQEGPSRLAGGNDPEARFEDPHEAVQVGRPEVAADTNPAGGGVGDDQLAFVVAVELPGHLRERLAVEEEHPLVPGEAARDLFLIQALDSQL